MTAARSFFLLLFLASLLVACTHPQSRVDEELEGGRLAMEVSRGGAGQVQALVSVQIGGRGPFPFVLDTGASQSLVDRRLASRLELEASGRDVPIIGVGGTAQASIARLQAWRVGDVPLPASDVAVLRLASPRSGDRAARGLLGSDVLRRFGVVTVDYANERVRLGRAAAPARGGWASAELEVVSGPRGATLPLVRVRLGGEERRFVVDTGASISAIDADLAKRLGLRIVVRDHPVVGVAGVARADLARLPRWRADDVRLPATRVAVLELPEPPRGTTGPRFSGLLGSDVLSTFGVVVLDYGEERLYLRRR